METIVHKRWMTYIVVLVAVIRFINLGFLDLQRWDESLHAVRTLTIIRFGDWLDQSPHHLHVAGDSTGVYYAAHPPLYSWCTAFLYYTIGISECSSRFVSAVAGALTILLLYLMGSHFFSRTVGFYSALFLGLTPFYNFMTRQGQYNVLLTFWMTLALYTWLRGLTASANYRRWSIITGIAIGFGLMTKLFVAGGVFIILLFSILLLSSPKRKMYVKEFGKVVFIAAIIALPWYIMMGLKYNRGSMLGIFAGTELVKHIVSGSEGTPKQLGVLYYFNQLLLIMPLAIPPACIALWSAWKKRREPDRPTRQLHVILAFWILFFFSGFSILSTKFAWWLLPIFPALVLLAGYGLEQLTSGSLSSGCQRLIIGAIGLLAIWAANFDFRQDIKMIFIHNGFHFPSSSVPVIVECGILIAILWLFSVYPHKISRLPTLIYIPLALLCAVNIFYLDRIQYKDGAKELADIIQSQKLKNIVVVGNGDNPQLSYYLDGIDLGWHEGYTFRRIELWNGTGSVKSDIGKIRGIPCVIIIEKDEIQKGLYTSEQQVLPKPLEKILDTKEYTAYIWQ